MPKLQDIVAEARHITDKRMPRNRIAALGDHGFVVYSAVTMDPIEDVLSLGYFDGLNFIEPWDRIELVADCEAEQPTFARLVVTGVEMVDGVMIRQPDTYTRVRTPRTSTAAAATSTSSSCRPLSATRAGLESDHDRHHRVPRALGLSRSPIAVGGEAADGAGRRGRVAGSAGARSTPGTSRCGGRPGKGPIPTPRNKRSPRASLLFLLSDACGHLAAGGHVHAGARPSVVNGGRGPMAQVEP